MRNPILIILFARCLAAQQASIEGTAIDAVTRQPLAGVHINMRHDSAENAWGAITRPDGHFSIAGMKPALYFLTAQRNGYIHLPGKNAALKPGDQLTGFIVEMTPRAVIAGRVLDEFGDPMQNVDVEATPVVPEPQLDEPGMGDRTDERGQFRMTGAPGNYYVKATYAPMGPVKVEPVPGLPAPPAYAATFYPSSIDKDRAHVVEVAPGHDLNGIDIRLVCTLSLTVSGVVTGVPDGSPPPLVWVAVAEENNERLFNQTAPDGKFRFPLAPGHYRILASTGSGDNRLRSQLLDVHLESVDETDLNLKLTPGEELSGTLEIHGDPAKTTPLETLAVHLESYSDPASAPTPKGGAVDSDGAFHLSQIFPAKFRVTVRPLPENAYIDAIKLDDAEIPNGALDLTRGVGGARLKVTVGLNGGRLEGTVLGEDGKPFADPLAFVYLAATADDIDYAGGKPKFSFDGLRPGKYRLFAVDPRFFSGSLESFRALFPKGEEIEIREGDRLIKDVKVMAAENRDAKP